MLKMQFDYLLARLNMDEEGQTMAEYAVVLAVITIAVIAALGLMSTQIATSLGNITTRLSANS